MQLEVSIAFFTDRYACTPEVLLACVDDTRPPCGVMLWCCSWKSSSNLCGQCRELFEMGVRCFDIDIITTSDQQLLVTHPRSLQVPNS